MSAQSSVSVGSLSGSQPTEEHDEMIDALDDAPTGAPLAGRDFAFLGLTGIVLPTLILAWGWS